MSSFPFKLGLRRSETDKRDLKMQVPQNAILPQKYEIPVIRCIYNQGTIGSCSSNVICNQIMSLKDYSDNEYPSRLFQYYNSREITGNEAFDDGCTYRDAYRSLAKLDLQQKIYGLMIYLNMQKNRHKKHMIRLIRR